MRFARSPPILPRVLSSAPPSPLRSETPFAIRMQQSTRERVVDCCVVSKRGEHIVNEPAVVVDVARLLADYPRHPVSLGELDQRGGERGLVSTGVMQLHFDR